MEQLLETLKLLSKLWPIILIVFFIMAVNVLLDKKLIQIKKAQKGKYKYSIRPLMTDNEKMFYICLAPICKRMGFLLFSKVRLLDLLKPTDRNKAAVNHVIRKHVDFVLCHKTSLSPVLVIELDDNSHNSPKAQKRDADKDKALESAGIPIIRARTAYKLEESITNILQPIQ